MMKWLRQVNPQLITNVVIVVVFLLYLERHDRAQIAAAKEWSDRAEQISNRCHDNQSEATKVLRELSASQSVSNEVLRGLTVVVSRLNGD